MIRPPNRRRIEKRLPCYFSYTGRPVKASRLFAGNEHEIQTKRLGTHFKKQNDFYKSVSFDEKLFAQIIKIKRHFVSSFYQWITSFDLLKTEICHHLFPTKKLIINS